MRAATIDIGTNSVLLLVAERGSDGEVKAVEERAEITRLGQGVDRTGELAPDAIERTLSVLATYASAARELGVSRIVSVGTSAMRDARGGPSFAARAAEILGVAPRIVSGEEEARLTFAGSLSGLPLRGALSVFDVGGGSTEIIVGRRENDASRSSIERSISLDIGSVRLTERHVKNDPPTGDELSKIAADVDSALSKAPRPAAGTPLIGVAGTVTTLAALIRNIAPYDGALVHGLEISAQEIVAAHLDLASRSLADRKRMPALDPKRADVIVAGSLLVSRLLHWASARSIFVSDRGVRWGLALDELSESSPNTVGTKNFAHDGA